MITRKNEISLRTIFFAYILNTRILRYISSFIETLEIPKPPKNPGT